LADYWETWDEVVAGAYWEHMERCSLQNDQEGFSFGLSEKYDFLTQSYQSNLLFDYDF
jgi:hypothetical protein